MWGALINMATVSNDKGMHYWVWGLTAVGRALVEVFKKAIQPTKAKAILSELSSYRVIELSSVPRIVERPDALNTPLRVTGVANSSSRSRLRSSLIALSVVRK